MLRISISSVGVCRQLKIGSDLVFIVQEHTEARYWYSKSVYLSVRPCVCLSITFRY